MAGRARCKGDRPRPLNAYGASKAEAEDVVRALHPGALVIRTSAFFGPWDEHNFVTRTLRALEDGLPVDAADDEVVSPTYVPDLAHAVLDILMDGEEGTWHLTSGDAISWVELARRAARSAGLEDEERLIVPCSGSTLGRAAARPRYSVLGSERGTLLPPLDDALARFIAARAACLAMR
jgi:dTDP-4-dehydrorhamnose reductase